MPDSLQGTPFLGTWALLAEASVYEQGDPPRSGTYTLSKDGDALHFAVAWTDNAGQARTVEFSMVPDGLRRPLEDPAASSGSLTFVDAQTLDSSVFQGDVLVAHARRTLEEDRQRMKVVQSSVRADGSRFSNVAYYQRVL
jgi:hypothetical protein